MIRIKYKQITSDLLESRSMLAGHTSVRALLYIPVMYFQIQDESTKKVLAEGTASNLAYLKKKTRQALKNVGVVFQGEINKPILKLE